MEFGNAHAEAPRPAGLDDLEVRLVVAAGQAVRDVAGWIVVRDLSGLGLEPLDGDDRNRRLARDSADGGVWGQVFEARHLSLREQLGFGDGRVQPALRVSSRLGGARLVFLGRGLAEWPRFEGYPLG